jgi:hypothetical protein
MISSGIFPELFRLGYYELPIFVNDKQVRNICREFIVNVLTKFISKYGKSITKLTFDDRKDILNNLHKVCTEDLSHKEYLENLSLRIIKEELLLDNDEIQFIPKLLSFELSNSISNNKDEKIIYDIAPKDELIKRRIINCITQGFSWNYTSIYHLYKDDLPFEDNDSKVLEYDKLLNVLILSWLINAGEVKHMDEIQLAGQVSIDKELIVKSGAINFPLLLHENFKGVSEYLSKFGLPKPTSIAIDVVNQTDKFDNEIFDMIIGSYIWKKIYEFLVDYDQIYIKHTLIKLFELDCLEFFDILYKALNNENEFNYSMKKIINEISNEIF